MGAEPLGVAQRRPGDGHDLDHGQEAGDGGEPGAGGRLVDERARPGHQADRGPGGGHAEADGAEEAPPRRRTDRHEAPERRHRGAGRRSSGPHRHPRTPRPEVDHLVEGPERRKVVGGKQDGPAVSQASSDAASAARASGSR